LVAVRLADMAGLTAIAERIGKTDVNGSEGPSGQPNWNDFFVSFRLNDAAQGKAGSGAAQPIFDAGADGEITL
jgi:hypothetical protein